MLHMIICRVAAFTAAALAATAALSDTLPAGEVLALQGRAEAVQAEGLRALSPKDAVFVGDAVSTAAASRLSIRLGPDTTVRMGENTRLSIDEFLAEAGGEIVLDAGALLVDKDPESVARPLKVESAFGQIAVRGTEFFVGPSKGVFAVFVARGRVTVSAAGVSVTLGAGEGTDIARPGAPPSPPVKWGQPRIDAALASVR